MFSFQVNNIEEMVQDILVCRTITDTERYQIKNVLLEACLSQDEHILIDRVLYGVRKGLLKVEC